MSSPGRPSSSSGARAAFAGPELVELDGATCWVPAGWAGETDAHGTLVLERRMIPVELQVIGSPLRAIAEEMGAALVRAAFSANIKERRDCSTALFDDAGRMVAQAEHIPVHLGAMPEAVAAVMARDPQPGEVWVAQRPVHGRDAPPGHHDSLPDTARVRCHAGAPRRRRRDRAGEPTGVSRELYQEGIVIPPTRLDDELVALIAANCATRTSDGATCAPSSQRTAWPSSGSGALLAARPRAGRVPR